MLQHNETAKLISLNVGKPVAIAHGSKEVLSGIFKQPSQVKHALSLTGLDGDGQGDLVHHGGPDKAVCVYFEKRYTYWREQLEKSFEYGAFGENFTLSSWTEDDLCIGDIVQAGEIILQVSQPRQPCYKLGLRHELPELPVHVQQKGYTGFYFRVLQAGNIKTGTTFTVIHRHPAGKTISEANRIMYIDKDDLSGIRELLEVEELAASWQDQLGKRLSRLLHAE
ncbi:MOSC domain-containing protein [Paenibacillus sp. FSL H8-0548]|uniref:MOSC domain-containing protein n=1 Tax=Paenibacillus sp. FSL H8-0548 TaxID=1920422 RepID=UPI00096E06E4|nr:MOSC domain-containing protein [Paenibacillus sp. FSL H8-0548]OMF38310.1 MOSC domain-containing protein [Paenibacillus sp. FSL H8-0548]